MQDHGRAVARTVQSALRKGGSSASAIGFLQTRIKYELDEAQKALYEQAIEAIEREDALALPVPVKVRGDQLKRGMVVEYNIEKDLLMKLDKDAYLDPADGKWTISGMRSDKPAEVILAAIEPECEYFVTPSTLQNNQGLTL